MKNTKILILGGNGMLGHKLLQIFKDKFNVYSTVRGEYSEFEKYGIFTKSNLFENINVEHIQGIRSIVEELQPNYIINCIGIIKQLPSAKNFIKTIKINSLLPHQLVEIADEVNSKLITISTDCVFSGEKGMYSENDLPDAKDLYGKSKHLGEVTEGNHLTLRTSIIGRELNSSHSLIEWFLSNKGKSIKGFANAIYSGFPTIVFADIIADLILNNSDLNGLFHVSSEPINKYELLLLVKKYFEVEIEIEKDEEFKIDRSLDSSRFRQLTGFQPQSWEEMIKKLSQDTMSYSDWR